MSRSYRRRILQRIFSTLGGLLSVFKPVPCILPSPQLDFPAALRDGCVLCECLACNTSAFLKKIFPSVILPFINPKFTQKIPLFRYTSFL
jgi:hypothetical protein